MYTIRHARRRLSSDAGFTLVELLIYISLMVVVLLIVGGMLINSLKAEKAVRNSTQATNAGQLVSQSVGQGVRNALAIKVTTPSAGTSLLTVLTASTSTPPTLPFCQAWYFGAGQVRTTKSTTLIPTSSVANWTLLGTDFLAVSEAPLFIPVPVFAPLPTTNTRSVTLNLDVSTSTGKPVRISTTSTSRQPLPSTGVEDGAPCF